MPPKARQEEGNQVTLDSAEPDVVLRPDLLISRHVSRSL